MHDHNLAIGAVARDHAIASEVPDAPTPVTDRTFLGYRRPDGRVGTRNYIAIISTVNCSASVAQVHRRRLRRRLAERLSQH